MKLISVGLTVALLTSGMAAAAPSTLDAPHVSSLSPIQEVVVVDDVFLDVTTGGLNRTACIGVSIGLGLAGLAAGAMTGGVLWALGGAYAPAVGTLLCSL